MQSLGKVLIVNADYSPVTIVSVERSMILLCTDKADIVTASTKKVLRTSTAKYPFPSVVKLKEFVKLPFKKVPLTKRNVFRRDNFECQYCGSTKEELTVDHIVPSSKKGPNEWSNLITACKRCNNAKGDMSLEETGMKLRKSATRPSHILFLRSMAKEVSKDWEQYLFN